MKWPTSLVALVDYGIVDEVLRPLMSGKEAQVYLVRCGEEQRVAKVYKEAEGRSFRQRADYTEGRKTRNSRDQRAVDKRTRHGKAQDEAAWRVAEVDRIRRLRDAGVRVPEAYEFVDGVLVMELVKDANGEPAPRLGDLSFSAAEAGEIYDQLIRETVRMLAADIVHGDLSEFNVLMGADGPVIIDFPQAVDPTSNRNARTLLLRDVQNLHRFLSRFAPGRKVRRLGEEMWKLYEEGKLKADTAMRGTYKVASGPTDTGAVMALIEDAKLDALREIGQGRRAREDDSELDGESEYTVTGSGGSEKAKGPTLRRVVEFTPARSKPKGGGRRGRTGGGGDRQRSGSAREGRAESSTRGRGQKGRGARDESEARGSARNEHSGSRGQRSGNSEGVRETREGAGHGRSGGRGRNARGSRGSRSQPARGERDGQPGHSRDGRGADRQEGASGRSGGQRSRQRDRETNDARTRRGSASSGSGSAGRSADTSAANGGEPAGRPRRSRRSRGSGSGQGNASAASDRERSSSSPRTGSQQQPRDRGGDRNEGRGEAGGARKRSRRRRRRPSNGKGNEPKS